MTTTTTTTRAQTAATILDQLTNAYGNGKGTSRVVTMLGARNISHTPQDGRDVHVQRQPQVQRHPTDRAAS